MKRLSVVFTQHWTENERYQGLSSKMFKRIYLNIPVCSTFYHLIILFCYCFMATFMSSHQTVCNLRSTRKMFQIDDYETLM